MPTFQPRTRIKGFTLIEMLVVLTVIGLVAAVLAGSLRREPGSLQRKRAALILQGAIVAAEREARDTGRPVQVNPGALVPGAQLAAVLGASESASLAVYPDGSSNGGTIALAGAPLIKVDWLTSEVVREN